MVTLVFVVLISDHLAAPPFFGCVDIVDKSFVLSGTSSLCMMTWSTLDEIMS